MRNTEKKKKDFLRAYEESMGNVSRACEKINISRRTYYLWIDNDNDFAETVNEIDEKNIDFAETMLLKNIREGKETSLIFFLKTKGRNRGYIEKIEGDFAVNSFEQLMKSLPDESE